MYPAPPDGAPAGSTGTATHWREGNNNKKKKRKKKKKNSDSNENDNNDNNKLCRIGRLRVGGAAPPHPLRVISTYMYYHIIIIISIIIIIIIIIMFICFIIMCVYIYIYILSLYICYHHTAPTTPEFGHRRALQARTSHAAKAQYPSGGAIHMIRMIPGIRPHSVIIHGSLSHLWR